MPTGSSLSPRRLERFSLERASERRTLAVARAREAAAALAKLGIEARIVGSLASGRFRAASDIDFLIVACPRHLKYGIEGIVEECLGGLPFDVIYLDEVPTRKLDRLIREAVDARGLR